MSTSSLEEYRKLDDERPKITDTLEGADLTNASGVDFYLEDKATNTLVVNASATIANASTNEVEYEFADGDLNTTGTHLAEWKVTYTDGDVGWWPKDQNKIVFISDGVNRGGSVSDPQADRAGGFDIYLFDEQPTTPDSPATGMWGLYFDSNGELVKIDENGTVSGVGGAGSAIEAQEDGTTLSTSASLVNWAAGLTATEPVADEIQIDVDESEVNHDALLNYTAAEHFTEGSISHDGIDQTTVSSDDHHTKTTTLDELTDSDVVELITTTAANLPAAGTADRVALETDTGRTLYDNGTSWVEVGLSESQIALANINGDTDDLTEGASNLYFTDERAQDAVGTILGTLFTYDDATPQITLDEGEIDHDALLNFVANEHVDHSTVNITAGTLLTGGGDITASRTLNVDEGSISHDGIDQTTVSEEDHHPRGGSVRSDVTTTSVTASAWDSLWVDTATAGGAVTVTLPADADVSDGDRVRVSIEDGTNDTTVSPNTGQTILGSPTTLINTGETIMLEYKVSNSTWMVNA